MTHRAVYKSRSVEFLDRFYAEDPAGALQTGGDLLANPEADAFDVASSWASENDFDADELRGFRNGWLRPDSPFGGKDVDRVIRLSNREAIALAGAHSPAVPIETFWVRGAGDDFEVHIHDGVDRVTLFWMVPVDRDYGSTRAETSSWVVRVGTLDHVRADVPRRELDNEPDPVRMIQVSGPLPDDAEA